MVESEISRVWLVAPLPDPAWGSDLRPSAKVFDSEERARAVLNDCPPEFHLWRATRITTRVVEDYQLIE